MKRLRFGPQNSALISMFTSLCWWSWGRKFFYNLQTFRGFFQVHFYDFVANIIQHENFLPTSQHRQAKVRCSLGICLYDCFFYRSNFVFRKCLEMRCYLGSGRKTVNSQGYSELREPIKLAKIAIHLFGKY